MAKVKLTYTEQGKRLRRKAFKSVSDANEYLQKLEQLSTVISSKITNT